MDGRTDKPRILKSFCLEPVIVTVLEDPDAGGQPCDHSILVCIKIVQEGEGLREVIALCPDHARRLGETLDEAALFAERQAEDSDQSDSGG
jgi:hypothetical protein